MTGPSRLAVEKSTYVGSGPATAPRAGVGQGTDVVTTGSAGAGAVVVGSEGVVVGV